MPALFAAPALAAQSEVTRLQWLSAPPAWVSFLVVLGALSFALFVYLREHSPAGRGPRLLLAIARALAFLAIWVLLAELVETTTREEVRPSWVVVMVDDSVSMTLRDRFGDRARVEGLAGATGVPEDRVEDMTRLDLVKRALQKDDWALLRALSEKNQVKVYSFSQRPLPVAEIESGALQRRKAGGTEAGGTATEGAGTGTGTGAEGPVGARAALEKISALEATGPETAIGDCLNRVINETRGQHVAGVVLVTDGRSNSGVTIPQKAARRLKSRGVPLFTVGVGNPDEPKDIALMDLQVPEVVIAGDNLMVKVSVKAQGFEGEEGRVDVVLKLDDEVVKTEPVELQGGGAKQDVAVRVKPERPGEYTLSIEVPPRPGELIEDNNRLTQKLRVIDKKIKVLVVESGPRYEFRYLRNAIVRDKTMEAHTFLISADPEFPQDASQGLSPLGAVPSTREELFQYHVIVLGDVDPHDAQLGQERMKLIREFVEEQGGGLLVIAGQHFMPRAYAGTPLESLLPVMIETGEDELGSGSKPITEDFRPKITLDGRRHPILLLENDPEQNLELWEARGQYGQGLPGFYWYYKPREKKRTAEALVVHPEAQTAKQEPVPIFAVLASGAGSTFFSAVDEVWRWRAGVGDRYTYRLWGQAIRYLSTGRLLRSKRASITTDKVVYDLGERVTIQAEVNDRSMKPATDETQTAYLEGPDGQAEKVELGRLPQAPGRYEATKVPARVGTYRVSLGVPGEGAPPRPETGDDLAQPRVFQVQVPILEKSDPKMDEELLKKMAASTGGRHFDLAQVASLPRAVGTVREVTEVGTARRELWDRWWILCSVVGLLCVEWIARKYWKML